MPIGMSGYAARSGRLVKATYIECRWGLTDRTSKVGDTDSGCWRKFKLRLHVIT